MSTTVCESRPRAGRPGSRCLPWGLQAPPQEDPPTRSSWIRRRWLVVLAVAAYLLFCHGCHGDEDNELFARAAGYVSAAP